MLLRIFIFSFTVLSAVSVLGVARLENPWVWRCTGATEDESECIREQKSSVPDPDQISLNACKITCGKYGTIVPRPQNATIGKQTVSFVPSNIVYNNVACLPHICPLLMQAVAIMIGTLNKYHPDNGRSGSLWKGPSEKDMKNQTLFIHVSVNGTEEYLTVDTDESYSLNISTTDSETTATIIAPTFFGARHAMETLSQLIDYDEENDSLQVVSSAMITDEPVFPHRGFSLDSSRNFIPIKEMEKVLEGMAYNKLNTLHWHLTDTHSFPLHLDTLPKMSLYGAYSHRHVYKPREIKDLVQYARVRGIKIIPEIDAPAHVGHGWEWGEKDGLGKLVVCLNKQPWRTYCLEPPCGQLNLANEKIYDVLGTIYTEVMELFSPVEMFHFGGDEIHLNCWNTSSEMVDWMTAQGMGHEEKDFFELWNVFQEKARTLLVEANNNKSIPGILWTSELTRAGIADKFIDVDKYIIHIWTRNYDQRIPDLLQRGYRVIFSNFDAFYLDCGSASWVSKGQNWCSPYKGWQDVYDNDIHAIAVNLTGTDAHHGQILGGEAAVWTEQIDDMSLGVKLWPRGSALAERLWTNPSNDYSKAEHRILQQRHRLVQRGIPAERLQPEWCRQNQGQCRDPNWVPSQ